ncbi:MAG: hypothetical protein RLY87_2484 [Chloroflexota bacterium]
MQCRNRRAKGGRTASEECIVVQPEGTRFRSCTCMSMQDAQIILRRMSVGQYTQRAPVSDKTGALCVFPREKVSIHIVDIRDHSIEAG